MTQRGGDGGDADPNGSQLPGAESAANAAQAQLRQLDGLAAAPKPERTYDAITVSVNKRFSKNWLTRAAYTYSRLIGNYDGLYQAEQNYFAPNGNNAYDTPDLYANQNGPLPNDRPHLAHVDGFYTRPRRQRLHHPGPVVRGALGHAAQLHLGAAPRPADLIMLLPRGSGGRTPTVTELNGRIAYRRQLSPKVNLETFIDLFNIFNQQAAVLTDDNYTYSWAGPDRERHAVGSEVRQGHLGRRQSSRTRTTATRCSTSALQRPLRPAPDVLASARAVSDPAVARRPPEGTLGRDARPAPRAARAARARRSRWHRARNGTRHVRACRVRRRGRDRSGAHRRRGRRRRRAPVLRHRRAGRRRASARGGVRIRGALENSGFKLPPRRITVNLAPADLRKDGAAFDVPIAVGMLARGRRGRRRRRSTARCSSASWRSTARCGPCAACCRSRPGRAARGVRRLVVPPDNAGEAAVVGGCEVQAPRAPGRAGRAAARRAGGAGAAAATPCRRVRAAASAAPIWPTCAGRRSRGGRWRSRPRAATTCCSSGRRARARRCSRSGCPGSCRRSAFDEALETTMVYSTAGLLGGAALVGARPFRAPHHTVSAAGLVGGGPDGAAGRDLARPQRRAVPRRAARVPALGAGGAAPAARGPRRHDRARPARRHLPGRLHAHRGAQPLPVRAPAAARSAPASARRRRSRPTASRLSGPLLDRIDLHVDVPALPYRELAHAEPGEIERAIRARVVAARERQQARGPRWNARLTSTELRRVAPLDGAGHALLERAVARLGLSARAITRVRRVARTIADLDGQRRRSRPRTSPRPSSTASSINQRPDQGEAKEHHVHA